MTLTEVLDRVDAIFRAKRSELEQSMTARGAERAEIEAALSEHDEAWERSWAICSATLSAPDQRTTCPLIGDLRLAQAKPPARRSSKSERRR